MKVPGLNKVAKGAVSAGALVPFLAAGSLLSLVASANASGVMAATIEADHLYSVNTQLAAAVRTVPAGGQFWDFCSDTYCNFGGASGLSMYVATSGGFVLSETPDYTYSPTENISFKVDAVASTATTKGRLSLDAMTEPPLLAALKPSQSVGVRIDEQFGWYAFPNWSGDWQFEIGTSLDQTVLPTGFKASSKTTIEVGMYSSWTDANGKFQSYWSSIYSGGFDGSGLLSMALPLDLDAYPVGSGAVYGSYSVRVSRELVVSSVPEPQSYALVLAGAVVIGASMCRAVKRRIG